MSFRYRNENNGFCWLAYYSGESVYRNVSDHSKVDMAPVGCSRNKGEYDTRTAVIASMRVAQGLVADSFSRSGCWFMRPVMARTRDGQERYLFLVTMMSPAMNIPEVLRVSM